MVRTRRAWRRSSWSRAHDDDGLRLIALREFLIDHLDAEPGSAAVSIPESELRRILDLTAPGPRTPGAEVRDDDRGLLYRVTLDMTTKPDTPRLSSVEVVRDRLGAGLDGWTMKGGTPRRKGKPGTYVAPYDESAFRVPVQELVAQTLAVLAVPGIVIGARRLPPPTPQQLRDHLTDGMTPPQIAEKYDRKPRAVYGWLSAARQLAPDLDWPEVKHGPIPKTSDADRAPGKKGTQE